MSIGWRRFCGLAGLLCRSVGERDRHFDSAVTGFGEDHLSGDARVILLLQLEIELAILRFALDICTGDEYVDVVGALVDVDRVLLRKEIVEIRLNRRA